MDGDPGVGEMDPWSCTAKTTLLTGQSIQQDQQLWNPQPDLDLLSRGYMANYFPIEDLLQVW